MSSNKSSVQSTNSVSANAAKGATIPIDPNGPADTVRLFYKDLRERKFREAIFLTNIRPAIEGLTDMELKEFQVDFEAIAGIVPPEIQINGEIVSGDRATVTVNLPDPETEENKVQSIKLRRENDVWTILSTDETAEKNLRRERTNYFYQLRIQTHENEARKMLDRIIKAEMVYSLQNEKNYADIPVLVEAGLVPDDAKSADSTGYNYAVTLSTDKKKYTATATPAEYGKSGRLSFVTTLDAKGTAHLNSKINNGGKTMSN